MCLPSWNCSSKLNHHQDWAKTGPPDINWANIMLYSPGLFECMSGRFHDFLSVLSFMCNLLLSSSPPVIIWWFIHCIYRVEVSASSPTLTFPRSVILRCSSARTISRPLVTSTSPPSYTTCKCASAITGTSTPTVVSRTCNHKNIYTYCGE